MRIISGEAKGRVLKTRSGQGTRPTDARAREMLFNILGDRVLDARVLDLYAGTGAVGLEALSRGAARCIFIEQNAVAVKAIRENVRILGWQERAQIWQASVKSALARLVETGARFDLVFADPPFIRPEELRDLCNRLDNSAELLHNVGGQSPSLLVIQHHRKAAVNLSQRFTAIDARRAGESLLSFFAVNGEAQQPGGVSAARVEPIIEIDVNNEN